MDNARQRYLQALMDEYDAYDWEQSGRLDKWLRLADDIEREACDGSHPRTYSLVGGGLDMFLVTDDESGVNLGYARKIGGPITKPVVRA